MSVILKAAVRAVRIAYDLSLDDDLSLQRLCEATAPIVDHGLSVSINEFVLEAHGQPRMVRYAQHGGDQDFARVAAEFQSMVPPEWAESIYLSPGYVGRAFSEDSLLSRPEHRAVADLLRARTRIKDIFGAVASWERGRGTSFSAPMAEVKDLSPSRRSVFRHVLAHMRCALRLRQRLEQAPEDMIWDASSGRIVHAEGAARSASARDKLRAQARAIDRAKSTAGGRDAEAALLAWKGLVDGTWTLVDQFDSDARHFVVAKRNAPCDVDVGRLSLRERQCAVLAATGAADKFIGYELGISASTVATHLQSARVKLGCDSRVALCRIAHRAWREPVDALARARNAEPLADDDT